MTQSEAKKFCEEEQEVPARLIEIDSAEENRAINAEMQRRNSFSQKINFWLGITDRHSEGHWVLESTGKSVNYTNWNSGEPNNGNGNPGSENCAFINELEGWNDVDCNGKPNNGWTRTALCEKSCAAPWTQLSTGCYRFHESPMTQSEAKKFCEEEQEVPAHLVEIDSAEENRAIIAEMHRQNSFSQKINFWLGITDRHSEGHWVLESTGKSVNFTDWKSGEPNNAGRSGSENCAFINELEGWNDVDCNHKPNNGWTRTAFCEKRDLGLQQKGVGSLPLLPVTATQSSTSDARFIAAKCIDGDTTGVDDGVDSVFGDMCHTNEERAPWFAIDYGRTVTVATVEIFNRVSCCGDRTRNVDVRISDELPVSGSRMFSGGTLFGHFAGPATNGQHITISGEREMSGRYVIVQMDKRFTKNGESTPLNLKEVRAFGRL